MRIISFINTSSTHRMKERSLRRTPMQIMAAVFAASALALGVIVPAAGAPSPDVSAAVAAAVALTSASLVVASDWFSVDRLQIHRIASADAPIVDYGDTIR